MPEVGEAPVDEPAEPEAPLDWVGGAVCEPLGAEPLAEPLAEVDPEPVLLGRAGVEVRVTPTVAQSC